MNLGFDMTYSINIFYANQKIGLLKQDKASGLLNITYNEYWQKHGFSLSPALKRDNSFNTSSVYNFLDNQLPEGEARNLLAQDLGVNEKQIFPQIRAIGSDLSGAVSFKTLPDEEKENATFRPIPLNEMIKRLDQKEDFGLLHWDDKPRLSVAGVQDKLNVFVTEKGEIGLGDGSLCSTHILKFERKNSLNLVLNEYICMKLSAAVGLPTAPVEFRRFAQYPALLVTRFDRKYIHKDNKVLRRHVIDGCQALDLPRDYKYERNLGDGRDVEHIRDGASLEKLFSLCSTSSSPVKNIQWLINWQLFNLMINNFDSHGKNISFYYGNNYCEFTPSYDLVNVSMFPQFKHILAMAMGDEFDPNTINAYQLADFSETCNIDKKLLSRLLSRLVVKANEQLTSLAFINDIFDPKDKLFSEEDRQYAHSVIQNIKSRVKHLESEITEITKITV